MTPRLSIGIGCSSLATVDDVIRLIQGCVAEVSAGSVLSTLDRRADIAEAVSARLGLKMMLFSAVTLAQVSGTTIDSALAASEVGTPSVAEAAALAALGPAARLIVPRQTGHLCTCAVAVIA